MFQQRLFHTSNRSQGMVLLSAVLEHGQLILGRVSFVGRTRHSYELSRRRRRRQMLTGPPNLVVTS